MPLHVVILAAGKGTRMKSARPKVLHSLAGRPVIEHVLRTVDELRPDRTVVVVGHGGDDVRAALGHRTSVEFVVQSPQLGTGDAMLQTEAILGDARGTVLLLYAAVPLLSAATLQRLLETHRHRRSHATVLTAHQPDPYGYGRVVRDDDGAVSRIVEEQDASLSEREIREINTGIYAFELDGLFPALHRLAAETAPTEFFLADLFAHYHRDGRTLAALPLDATEELRAIQTREDLAELTRVLRARRARTLMLNGVTLDDPATTSIDEDVTVGADTVIGPRVELQGRTTIGARCHIHAGVRLTDTTIGDDAVVLDHSIVIESEIGSGAQVGPFAHVRPGSHIGENARVGNFVELKKTALGKGSKANHLAYLGDATIGERVNVGAGTITCNYDGASKHPTVIEDNVFIGSDSQLVAPVTIGRGAYVAAGSSITEDVPADALGIARARQQNKAEWAAKRRAWLQEQKARRATRS